MGMFSRANKLARKSRHNRIHDFKKTATIKRDDNVVEKKASEKDFFWRILSTGTFIFFAASILPNIIPTEENFWIPAEASLFMQDENFALAEEGFIIKPDIQTERGSRENITEIIEITVEPGDTLSTIAHKYGISIKTLMDNNDIVNANMLKPGQKLTILPVDGLVYEVQKGDTIAKIAKNKKVEKEKLIAQNELSEESELKIGQKLILPGIVKPAPVYRGTSISRASGAAFSSLPNGLPTGNESYGKLFFPCQGKYTQYYHYGHYAVDIAQNGGSPIWAAESGTVIKAKGGWNGGYGNMVIIDHGNGMTTLYAHMRVIYIKEGDRVGRGQAIGYMGNTGRVYGRTGIHLHFEVIVNGIKKNPAAYF